MLRLQLDLERKDLVIAHEVQGCRFFVCPIRGFGFVWRWRWRLLKRRIALRGQVTDAL